MQPQQFLYTLVYFTQIPEWLLPANVIDLLDFSIRKITSVAVFLITFFSNYNFLIFATRHSPLYIPWKNTAYWWQCGEKDSVWMSVRCQTSSGETAFDWWVQRGGGEHKYIAGPSFLHIDEHAHTHTQISCARVTWRCVEHIAVVSCVVWVACLCTADLIWEASLWLRVQTWPGHQKQPDTLERYYSRHHSLTVFPDISACLQWHTPNLLKSLQHVVNSLPKGNLHVPPLGIQPVRNTKEENAITWLQGVRFLIFFFFFSRILTGYLRFSLPASPNCVCAYARWSWTGWAQNQMLSPTELQ